MTNTAPGTRPLKVLLLADLCNSAWPSLPVVGYKYAKALSKYTDATVVTQVRNRPDIMANGLGQAQVAYVDTEKIAARMWKLASLLRGGSEKGWTLQIAMDYPAYLAFERKAWHDFRGALESRQFDVVHRITPMSPTLPSYMAGRSPVPFVLGPLNGNLPWPRQFAEELRREREWMNRFRGAYKYLPYHKATYARSAAVLAAFSHTMADLPREILGKTIDFPEVGIDPALFSLPIRSARPKLTILYAGRLVPYKLPEVLIRAVASSPLLRQHRVLIVGDGPDRERLEAMVRDLGLDDCVEMLGKRPQAEVGQLMREAEVFAFPSIRELGAGVVVEAMACGMACVVVDYGGPATLIQPGWGIKVPMGSKDHLAAGFRDRLEFLVENPDRARALGMAAHEHAMAHYTWDAKARKTVEVYEWLLGRRSTKPDFWEPVSQTSGRAAQPNTDRCPTTYPLA
jgi:glycosyltransferase involved in cell wall biosynthesis